MNSEIVELGFFRLKETNIQQDELNILSAAFLLFRVDKSQPSVCDS